jgi:hypothetical protein
MIPPAPATSVTSLVPSPHFIEMTPLGLGQEGFPPAYDAQGTGHAMGACQDLLELGIDVVQGFLPQLSQEQIDELPGLETLFFENAIGLFANGYGLVFHCQATVHGCLPLSLKKSEHPIEETHNDRV